MYSFSENSKRKLSECDEQLQKIAYVAIKGIDISVVEGYRNKEDQNNAYEQKLSKLKYPESKHNKKPSKAFHLLPYPKGWKATREEFVYMAGKIEGIAMTLGISIRWGGNWDSDNDLKDQTFMDLAHFELI
ncbi:MAG: M15 family peptidase [Planctomycetia bacterium]|nr:M15 family peptidase [Planctomycetia bacterium]